MKILAFAGSNSAQSINKKLVSSVSKYYKEPDDLIEILDLNDYELPLYSVDRERESGVPTAALAFADKINQADFILISLAENNGNYNASYKNLMDWISRIPQQKIFAGKPVFVMATSPGKRGGQSVLDIAIKRMPFDGAEVIESFSLPEFHHNFEEGKGLTNMVLRSQLEAKVRKTKRILKEKLTAQ